MPPTACTPATLGQDEFDIPDIRNLETKLLGAQLFYVPLEILVEVLSLSFLILIYNHQDFRPDVLKIQGIYS